MGSIVFQQPVNLERRLDAAFLLASDACLLEIQLPFHAAAGLVGDPPFLQKAENEFPLGIDQLGAKAWTKGHPGSIGVA